MEQKKQKKRNIDLEKSVKKMNEALSQIPPKKDPYASYHPLENSWKYHC